MIGAAHRQHAPRGFTLLEILIVAMLITLFSGIAMFAVREMYEQNRYKAMPVEASNFGAALSFAFNDIGFYPRLHLLNQSLNTMVILNGSTLMARPHMDTYGIYNSKVMANRINTKWSGPYAAKSPVRVSVGQRSTVKMHLVDTETILYRNLFRQLADTDIEVVNWPADTWGNPWMLYQVSKHVDPDTKQVTYKLAKPDEKADFLNAVVSYGANHIPGGNLDTLANNPAYYDEMKTQSALYFEENPQVAGAEFVLRSFITSQQNLDQLTSNQLRDSFYFPGTADPKTGAVGMLQEGTDDIVWVF